MKHNPNIANIALYTHIYVRIHIIYEHCDIIPTVIMANKSEYITILCRKISNGTISRDSCNSAAYVASS